MEECDLMLQDVRQEADRFIQVCTCLLMPAVLSAAEGYRGFVHAVTLPAGCL